MRKSAMCAKMKTFLLIYLCYFVTSSSQDKGATCPLTDEINIDETAVGVKIKDYHFTENVELTNFDVDTQVFSPELAKPYFNLTMPDTHTLEFRTTKSFGNLGEVADSNGSVIAIIFTLTLNCSKQPSMITLTINDSFSKTPYFPTPSFSYNVPMPLMPKTDFSLYGDEITISDKNFANTDMTFSMTPDDFEVITSKITNKKFKAIFKAKHIIKITEPKTYTLTAKDSGNQKTDLSIILSADPTTGLDSPSFKRPDYSFDYSINGTVSLIPKDGDIVIESLKADGAHYKLSGDSSELFEISFEKSINTFALAMKPESKWPEATNQIVLTLSYTSDDTAYAVLLINNAPTEEVVPTFSHNYYTGTYDIVTKGIKWSENVAITNATIVVLAEGKSDLFRIDQEYTISPKDSLHENDFDENRNIFFTIVATSSTNIASVATVSISLKLEEFKFDKAYYNATYSINNKVGSVVLDTGNDIGFLGLSKLDGVSIAVEDKYQKYFKIELVAKKWVVKVLRPLPEIMLNKNTKLAISLTATKGGLTKTATDAVLIVALPEKPDIEFNQPYYLASYEKGTSTDIITLNQTITINGASFDEIDVQIAGYEDNFKINYNSSTSSYEIDVQRKLNESVLNSETQLPLTLVARTSDGRSQGASVILLTLPASHLSFHFEKSHYEADYRIVSKSAATVEFTEYAIKIVEANDVQLQFSLEGYDDNFKLIYNKTTSSYDIEVIELLDSSVIRAKAELVLTITAAVPDSSYETSTVLVLKLPQNNATFEFQNYYYSATYIRGTNSDSVKLNNSIKLRATQSTKLTFSFDEYSENFDLERQTDSSYHIIVRNKLNSTVLTSSSPLKIIITATDSEFNTASTVLLLDLPSQEVKLEFKKQHYLGKYSLEGKGQITLEDEVIKIVKSNGIEPQFTFENYDKYFQLATTGDDNYKIDVVKKLDESILKNNNQLILTLTASTKNNDVKGKSVLILNLPSTQTTSFTKSCYKATYESGLVPSIILEELLVLTGRNGSNVELSFEGYDKIFRADFDTVSNGFNISMTGELNSTILYSTTELFIEIRANDEDSETIATTTLAVNLPSYTITVFEKDHYTAEYKLNSGDGPDEIKMIDAVKVRSSAYTKVTFVGYEKNFDATCDSSTLLCKFSVHEKLNITSLNSGDNLLITLVATSDDNTISGRVTLSLKLPPKTSTFSFSQPYYSGVYTIEKNVGAKATINLSDVIDLEGNDLNQVTIVANGFSDYFSFSHETSHWNLNILKNLKSDILEHNKELVITLTATKPNSKIVDSANAILILQLPDSSTIAFLQPQYSAQYIIESGTAKVVFDKDSEIQVTDSDNVEIVLNSYSKNFVISQSDHSKWGLNVEIPLNASVLTEYSELKLLISITKVGVKYDTAGLTIKLPSFRFSEDKYSVSYFVSEKDAANISIKEEIEIANIDMKMVNLKLSDYSKYFVPKLSDDKWTIELHEKLPESILSKERTLVTTLLAERNSDKKVLATSTLAISLPIVNNTNAPEFSSYTYYATYENSDKPFIKLDNLISLNNYDPDNKPSISIDTNNTFSTYFKLIEENNYMYNVTVATNLDQAVLDEMSSIVLTLVAKSTEGSYGFATLAITLPKAVRNSSIEIQNNEILFSGTYKDGKFSSPSIKIAINSSDDEDIIVNISNDLGIDPAYFTPVYSNKVLSVQVGKLPQEILNKTSLIPLKLAIKNSRNQDTVYAVLNIEISGSSSGNGGHAGESGDSPPTGLIVAVSILAFLLVLLLLGAFIFWYFKIRIPSSYAEMEDDVTTVSKPSAFTKNETRKPTTNSLSSSLRRPTGIAVGLAKTLPNESSSNQEESVSTDVFPDVYDKKVGFNDNIEKISSEEGTADENNANELLSVADRRPTKFVFGYPMELGILDAADERRESSDFTENNPRELKLPAERKKSVAFDENVERLQIDSVEDDEDDGNNIENPDASYRTESEIQLDNENALPSQVFKEIF